MGGGFDEAFHNVGVSGAMLAAKRPGFARLLAFLRKGDTLHVNAVDRLGRDALDVQSTVRFLLAQGVAVHVHGLGVMTQSAGDLILAVLAQVADLGSTSALPSAPQPAGTWLERFRFNQQLN